MFTITNLKYTNIYSKGLIFLPTHKSNFREFIKYENTFLPDLSSLSSVNLTSNNVEINLQLNKDFFELQHNVLYDVFIKFMKYDETTRKNVYRVQKVVISDAIGSTDEQYSDEDCELLDNYEITIMYNKVLYELDDKIKMGQDKLVMLLNRINNMEKNITNLNFIAEINNNFDKFFEKNYI